MSQNLCECHCGTRIDLDEQLLEQRQTWKQKYFCLERQLQTDIQALKQTIYAQCANLMQQEFSNRQSEHNQISNCKNQQIKDLTSRVICIQSQNRVLAKQKQILQQHMRQLEGENQLKDNMIAQLKSKSSKDLRSIETGHEQYILVLKKKLQDHHTQGYAKLEKENEHLKHKVKEFEKKYQTMLPEIQKLKNNLLSKTAQLQQYESRQEKAGKQTQKRIELLTEENDRLSTKNKNMEKELRKACEQLEELSRELEHAKKVKREVRVEPVYVDRPIQVPKIVEKIVEIEKIVKQYIEPSNSGQIKELEQDNRKLHQQLSKVVKQLHEIENKCQRSSQQYEECIRSHQMNVTKYKQERQNLVRRIEEQHKQLEIMQSFLERNKMAQMSNTSHDAQKIVIHVKSDGTHTKNVEKLDKNTAAQVSYAHSHNHNKQKKK